MWSKLNKYTDFGLLVIRLVVGIDFVIYGLMIFWGGKEVLTNVGSTVSHLGITHGHLFFGILAAAGELVGGLLFLSGAFFRPACLLLIWIMAMALTTHFFRHDPFQIYSHAMEMCAIFLGFFFIGPGKFSVDQQ